MVQRAFALAHLPLAHDRVTERFAQGDVEDASGRQILAAFLTDETGNVQVSVYRPAPETNEPTIRVRAIIEGGAPPTTTKTLGNVEVTYPKPGSDSPLVTPTFGSRVLVALAMLRSGYDGHEDNSRYRQGTDSTGAAYCVMYDHDGASGSVREGACPTH